MTLFFWRDLRRLERENARLRKVVDDQFAELIRLHSQVRGYERDERAEMLADQDVVVPLEEVTG